MRGPVLGVEREASKGAEKAKERPDYPGADQCLAKLRRNAHSCPW